MGIIADSFKATLEAIKKEDEIRQARINETLDRINTLLDTLEVIDSEN
jgi:ribosome assembly protein YihI (activator of Der GTPase)